MRGEPQNATITKEIIDKVFESAEDCEKVTFTGGEPFLEPDIIEYFVDKIIESNWTTKSLSVVTNGTIENEHIAEAFKRFCNSRNNRTAIIHVSFDKFHNIDTSVSAYVFYKRAVGVDSKITIFPLRDIEQQGKQRLVNSGRAKLYIEKHPELIYPLGDIIPLDAGRAKHRITIVDGNVYCLLQIGANGNVSFADDGSYEDEDSLSLGNLLQDGFCEIIDKHNDNCVLLCTERDKCQSCKDVLYSKQVDALEKLIDDSVRMVIEEIINIREFAHHRYSALPVETIIEMIPVPEQMNWYDELFWEMYEESQYFNNPSVDMLSFVGKRYITLFIKSKDKMSAEDKLCWLEAFAVNSLLNDKNEHKNLCLHLEKRGLFGLKLFKQLEELNRQYARGEKVYTGRKVFPCDSYVEA